MCVLARVVKRPLHFRGLFKIKMDASPKMWIWLHLSITGAPMPGFLPELPGEQQPVQNADH